VPLVVYVAENVTTLLPDASGMAWLQDHPEVVDWPG
jgi:hypothetical protein